MTSLLPFVFTPELVLSFYEGMEEQVLLFPFTDEKTVSSIGGGGLFFGNVSLLWPSPVLPTGNTLRKPTLRLLPLSPSACFPLTYYGASCVITNSVPTLDHAFHESGDVSDGPTPPSSHQAGAEQILWIDGWECGWIPKTSVNHLLDKNNMAFTRIAHLLRSRAIDNPGMGWWCGG